MIIQHSRQNGALCSYLEYRGKNKNGDSVTMKTMGDRIYIFQADFAATFEENVVNNSIDIIKFKSFIDMWNLNH